MHKFLHRSPAECINIVNPSYLRMQCDVVIHILLLLLQQVERYEVEGVGYLEYRLVSAVAR